ncbi:hypothetical protein BN970_01764 [Mycolicibacterium conceptionense]|uniref:Uncharacterized protein n=1 Tax=Mycolicibacterium conceptionense TaxID=451644 RepID=A0A0U1D6D9_9MYCO|nr:hypothetical protein BN970_01764 [Mycolicibacterium conceptionense]
MSPVCQEAVRPSPISSWCRWQWRELVLPHGQAVGAAPQQNQRPDGEHRPDLPHPVGGELGLQKPVQRDDGGPGAARDVETSIVIGGPVGVASQLPTPREQSGDGDEDSDRRAHEPAIIPTRPLAATASVGTNVRAQPAGNRAMGAILMRHFAVRSRPGRDSTPVRAGAVRPAGADEYHSGAVVSGKVSSGVDGNHCRSG